MTSSGGWTLRRVGLVVVLLCLGVATIFLFTGRAGHAQLPRSVQAAWNFAHVVYFFVLVVLARRFDFLQRFPAILIWAMYLGLVFALGLGIEILQMTPRIPIDWFDVWRDMIGGFVGLVVSANYQTAKGGKSLGRWLMYGAALAALFVAFKQTAVALIDEAEARAQFPVLSDFSGRYERWRWNSWFPLSVVDLPEATAGKALKVELDRAMYAGLAMEFFPRDWRRYHWLNLRVYQPDAEVLKVTLRAHDRAHETGALAWAHSDRFNRRFELRQGWNELRIALDDVRHAPFLREMDLSQMAGINLFASRLQGPRTIFIDRVFLSDQ